MLSTLAVRMQLVDSLLQIEKHDPRPAESVWGEDRRDTVARVAELTDLCRLIASGRGHAPPDHNPRRRPGDQPRLQSHNRRYGPLYHVERAGSASRVDLREYISRARSIVRGISAN